MKKGSSADVSSFRAVLRTAAKAARRKAFRKGLPIAVSKNGKVIFIYKGNREVIADSSAVRNSK